jgi:hypothetical protein
MKHLTITVNKPSEKLIAKLVKNPHLHKKVDKTDQWVVVDERGSMDKVPLILNTLLPECKAVAVFVGHPDKKQKCIFNFGQW